MSVEQIGLIQVGQFEGSLKMAKSYRSDGLAAIHETMESLHEVGVIDKQTMREFDEACLKANGDTCFSKCGFDFATCS